MLVGKLPSIFCFNIVANCAFILDRNVLDVLYEMGIRETNVEKWTKRDFDEARSMLKSNYVHLIVTNSFYFICEEAVRYWT